MPRSRAMTGEALHDYDLALSNYVLGNVRQLLDVPRSSAWLKNQLYPPAFLRYVTEGRNTMDEQEWLLLGDRDFRDLLDALEYLPSSLDPNWLAYEPLHQRYVHTVKEVKNALTTPVAEDWSRACVQFGKRLEQDSLSLVGGIQIVHEWSRHLRRLLQAMDCLQFLPRPEGQSPTPTSSEPAPNSSTGSIQPADESPPWLPLAVERMRQAMRGYENGANAPVKALRSKANIREQHARAALRWLAERGEYHGFDPGRRAQRRQPGQEHA